MRRFYLLKRIYLVIGVSISIAAFTISNYSQVGAIGSVDEEIGGGRSTDQEQTARRTETKPTAKRTASKNKSSAKSKTSAKNHLQSKQENLTTDSRLVINIRF